MLYKFKNVYRPRQTNTPKQNKYRLFVCLFINSRPSQYFGRFVGVRTLHAYTEKW